MEICFFQDPIFTEEKEENPVDPRTLTEASLGIWGMFLMHG
jgi:hypothetical protein